MRHPAPGGQSTTVPIVMCRPSSMEGWFSPPSSFSSWLKCVWASTPLPRRAASVLSAWKACCLTRCQNAVRSFKGWFALIPIVVRM